MNSSRPNILMVMMDSARPEWLSCYNSTLGCTPNLDALASESLVFEQAIGPSAWTFPVMASVFTGMLPAKHGGHDEHRMLTSAYPTLAEVLARNGYDTAAIADVPYVGPMTQLDRGFRKMSNLRGKEVTPYSRMLKAVSRVHRTVTGRYQKTFETRVVMQETLHWLRSEWDRSKPFFLFVHSDETHAPFLPPGRFRREFSRLGASGMHALNQDKQLFVAGVQPMSEAELGDLRDLARAEAAYLDEWLGVLFGRLRADGLDKDTIVVVAADHGENFGEHGLLRHGLCLYDTLLHVPLIVRIPGRSAKRVSGLVQLIDVMPSLMNAAGIREGETIAEMHGKDLLTQVDSGRFHSAVVSELYRPLTGIWERKVPQFMDEFRRRYDRVLRSLRTPTHKYLSSSNGRHELYNLVTDPGETSNIVDLEPALALQLSGELSLWLDSVAPAQADAAAMSSPDGAGEDDERVMERLRDLGYVE